MKLFFAIAALLAFATVAQAETGYIGDQAKMPMRSGEGTGFKITKMLPSGLAVEVLGQSKSGYSRIRTQDGKEGWILSRYLMKTPAARDRLQAFEQELSQLAQMKQETEAVQPVSETEQQSQENSSEPQAPNIESVPN